jgi:hypothetical protein
MYASQNESGIVQCQQTLLLVATIVCPRIPAVRFESGYQYGRT